MNLSYIIEKINASEFTNTPFTHLEINDLFEPEDFKAITSSSEIAISADSDEKLFQELFDSDYKIISFPGCTVNFEEYIKWHKDKKKNQQSNTACEGYGVVLRLQQPKTDAIKILHEFLESREFIECISNKFDVDPLNCIYDAGLQKYLDGYEISPHPDIRRKALTYMVNINPHSVSEELDHHTSYLTFKPEWEFVKSFWEGNKNMDRCWVPWDWCNIEKQQRKNNSIVIFSPNNQSMHAVKADYNHLDHQRTQLYGNLWYKDQPVGTTPQWEDFIIEPSAQKQTTLKDMALKYVPNRFKWKKKSSTTHADRNVNG